MIGIKIKERNNKMKKFYHENSLNLNKLKKKIDIELDKKKYSLTSRNENEDINRELINKMFRKKN
jgi:hypothetical protein